MAVSVEVLIVLCVIKDSISFCAQQQLSFFEIEGHDDLCLCTRCQPLFFEIEQKEDLFLESYEVLFLEFFLLCKMP